MRTPRRNCAPRHSSLSMSIICRDEPSQNSCPHVFSCQAMLYFSTSAMKSCWVYLLSAEWQNRGLSDRKFAGEVCRLVKLHRPPPEMRIFSAGCLACSSTSTDRPRLAATPAHISPAAPAPRMMTSWLFVWRAALIQPAGLDRDAELL